MANKKKNQGNAPKRRPTKTVFFEAGERSIPLEAVVRTVSIDAKTGTGTLTIPKPMTGPPHLRVLGWTYSIKPSGTEEKFLTSTGFARSAGRAVAGPGIPTQMPSVTVVGSPDTTATVLVTGSMWYKTADVGM